MKTAAIMMDNWKVPVFKKRLAEAGYSIALEMILSNTMTCLKVNYNWAHELHDVIVKIQDECKKLKGEKK